MSELRLILASDGEVLYSETTAAGSVVSWESGAELREEQARTFYDQGSASVLEERWLTLRKARECDGCRARLDPGDDALLVVTRDGGEFRRTYHGQCCSGSGESGARGDWFDSDLKWRAELPGMGSGSPDAL